MKCVEKNKKDQYLQIKWADFMYYVDYFILDLILHEYFDDPFHDKRERKQKQNKYYIIHNHIQ